MIFQKTCIPSHLGLFYVQSHSTESIFHMTFKYKHQKPLCSFSSYLYLDLKELSRHKIGIRYMSGWILLFWYYIQYANIIFNFFFLKNDVQVHILSEKFKNLFWPQILSITNNRYPLLVLSSECIFSSQSVFIKNQLYVQERIWPFILKW